MTTLQGDIARIDQTLGNLERLGGDPATSAPHFWRVLIDSLDALVSAQASIVAVWVTPESASPQASADGSSANGASATADHSVTSNATAARATATAEREYLVLAGRGSFGDAFPVDRLRAWGGGLGSTNTASATPAVPNWFSCRTEPGATLAVPLGHRGAEWGFLATSVERLPLSAESGIAALLEAFAEVGTAFADGQIAAVEGKYRDRLEAFLLELHSATSWEHVAACVAHDLPSVLNAGTVAVIQTRLGGGARVVAVTGVDSPERRTDQIRRLEHWGMEAVQHRRALLFDSSRDASDPEGAASFATANALAVLLGAPSVTDEIRLPRVSGRNAADDPPAVIVAQWQDADAMSAAARRLPHVLAHIDIAMRRCRAQTPRTWRLTRSIAGRPHRRVMLILILLVALLLVLWGTARVTVPFSIEANGTVEPMAERVLFAPYDGYVSAISVDEETMVSTGQPVLELRSPELELRLQEVEGEIAAATQRRDTLNIAINESDPSARDQQLVARQMAAEVIGLEQKIENLIAQRTLLQDQQDSLTLHSPINGKVVTRRVRRDLEARPVKRGDGLLRIADVDGPWHLRLKIRDTDAAIVRQRVQEASEHPLVTFRLLSQPGETMEGRITRIRDTTERADPSEDPYVMVDVAFDRDAAPRLQVAGSATARIDCGRRPWWYVWTRDLLEALQRRFWIDDLPTH